MTKQNEFINAVRYGESHQVKSLLKDINVNPAYLQNIAIQDASNFGHTTVVQLLLNDNRVNPSDKDNQAITFAWLKNHHEVIYLLWKDSRVRKLLEKNENPMYKSLSEEFLKKSISDF